MANGHSKFDKFVPTPIEDGAVFTAVPNPSFDCVICARCQNPCFILNKDQNTGKLYCSLCVLSYKPRSAT